MAGTIDRATLDRLIALGRQRGGLTASDLQAALPVDALDVDALVLVMRALDAAGVSVEPDAFGPRAEDGAPGNRLPIADPGAPTAPGAPSGDEPVGRVVLLAGLAVLLVLGTVLILV